MKKLVVILSFLIIGFSIPLKAQNAENSLNKFKYRIGKTLRFGPSLNECKLYIGYLLFDVTTAGKISNVVFFKSNTDSSVTFKIRKDTLFCKGIILPFIKDGIIKSSFSENIPLYELLAFLKENKINSKKVKLPIVILTSSETDYKENCEGSFELQSLYFLLNQWSRDIKFPGEMVLSPYVILQPAAQP